MEIIADRGDQCGECPVWDAKEQALYWTDCTGQKFFCYQAKTGTHRLVRSGLEINGFRRHRDGGFAIVNCGGAWLWDGAEGIQCVVSSLEGSPCKFNDCTADAAGRLIAGTNFYDSSGDYPLGKLVSIDLDGRAQILDEGFHLSNGLGFSPDGCTLYFTDSIARMIYAYDYQATTGAVRNRRVFVEVPRLEGLPDGLAVDALGHVWSAQWYGGCIVRYDPEGNPERRVELPAKQTSCLCFGGPELSDIYVTSAALSEPTPVMPPGYDPAVGPFGGQLFRLRQDIPGKPEPRAAIHAAGGV